MLVSLAAAIADVNLDARLSALFVLNIDAAGDRARRMAQAERYQTMFARQASSYVGTSRLTRNAPTQELTALHIPDLSPQPPADLQGWSLDARDPETIRALMPFWGWFYEHYFRVQTAGWEQIPDEQVLLVGSHNGGLAAPDMLMELYDWFRHCGSERPAYGLMHPNVWAVFPGLAQLAVRTGAIRARARLAIAALRSGASLLVYPGGGEDAFRPHWQRDRIYFAGRTGFIKLAIREGVPIVPLVSWGAHDTLLVLTDIYDQMAALHEWGMPWLFNVDPVVFPIYLGLPWGLSFGPLPNLPLPVQIHTRVCPPIRFEHSGRAAARDRAYVQACWQRVKDAMQAQLDELIGECDR